MPVRNVPVTVIRKVWLIARVAEPFQLAVLPATKQGVAVLVVQEPEAKKAESNASVTPIRVRPLVLETLVVAITYVTSVFVIPSVGLTDFEKV